MKYDASQRQLANNSRKSKIIEYNEKELGKLLEKWNISEVPQKLLETIDGLEYRISEIRLMSYDDFCDKFPARTIRGSFFSELGERNQKTGFPLLYVYEPELDYITEKMSEQATRFGNLKRITSFIWKRSGIQLRDDFAFKNFVMNVLPASIPFNLVIDGSRIRVANLAEKENAKMYGDTENDIFAVAHAINETPTLTIFVKEYDYIDELTRKLIKSWEIDADLAREISKSLPHDIYYAISDVVETNFEKFATMMAKLLELKPGDVAHDILQGDVEVVLGAYSKKVALNLDDKFPAVIIVKNRLNIYVPGWGEIGTDE